MGIILIALFSEFFSFGSTPSIDLTNRDKSIQSQSGYVVSHVVDGDTVDIEKDKQTIRVRLLGINTPETVDPRRPVECFGKEASDYTKTELNGQSVYIETDPTQSTYDKYGRLLAYVYTVDGQMINRKLIANGYAYEYTYDHPYKYQKEFKSLQGFARNEKRGLWAVGVCSNG